MHRHPHFPMNPPLFETIECSLTRALFAPLGKASQKEISSRTPAFMRALHFFMQIKNTISKGNLMLMLHILSLVSLLPTIGTFQAKAYPDHLCWRIHKSMALCIYVHKSSDRKKQFLKQWSLSILSYILVRVTKDSL